MFNSAPSEAKILTGGWLCSNLYDVFKNIRQDEEEHVKTMTACRDYSIVGDLVNKADAKGGGGGGAKVAPPPDQASIMTMDRTNLS